MLWPVHFTLDPAGVLVRRRREQDHTWPISESQANQTVCFDSGRHIMTMQKRHRRNIRGKSEGTGALSELWAHLSGTIQPLDTAECAAYCWRMDQNESRLFSSMHRARACRHSKTRTKCSSPNGLASTFPFHWLTNENTRKIDFIIHSQQKSNFRTCFNLKNV